MRSLVAGVRRGLGRGRRPIRLGPVAALAALAALGAALGPVTAVGVALGACGWVGLALALTTLRRARRRLERVARAEHELRGPVAVLALTRERMEREPTGRRYARALEVEVERLTAALADLTTARTGARGPAVERGGASRGGLGAPRGGSRARGAGRRRFEVESGRAAPSGRAEARVGGSRRRASAAAGKRSDLRAFAGNARAGGSRRGASAAAGKRSDLRAFAGGALAGWAPALRAAGRRTRLDWKAGPVALPRDRGRLAQALGNLVSNAAEHGAGEVEVRGRRVPGGVRVEVRNALPGEPARATRRDGGRGLPIATDAARELGGRLVVERGRRSFRAAIELPVGEASKRRTARAPSTGRPDRAPMPPRRDAAPAGSRRAPSPPPQPAAPRPYAPSRRRTGARRRM